MLGKNEFAHGFKSCSPVRKIHAPKPPKPVERAQNLQTPQSPGTTSWNKAHWRFNYETRKYEWIEGRWVV